jgi:Flp pilus assembly protein TadG
VFRVRDLRWLRHRLRDERGSAVVEFTLVMPLLMIVMLGVLQLTLAQHVRSTLISAAAEGARVAAMMNSDLDAGVQRTEDLLRANMAGAAVQSVTAERQIREGLPVVTVDVVADLPLIGFFGPTQLYFTGTALDEQW